MRLIDTPWPYRRAASSKRACLRLSDAWLARPAAFGGRGAVGAAGSAATVAALSSATACAARRPRAGQQARGRRRPGCAAGAPAVGHLDGIRRAMAGAVGIGAGPVARDHLHPGVLAQPGGQGFSLAVRQQVHDGVVPQVHQRRAVAMAMAPTLRCHSIG